MPEAGCAFCPPGNVVCETRFFYVVRDNFPVNPGHLLAVLKRHVPSALHLTAAEWEHLRDAIDQAVAFLSAHHSARAFNIGVNVGADAGQTVDHVHVHIIPRYPGDCDDPRGGVRWVKAPLVEY